ncbi:MAG: CubicO group peptidase (beta-lactamase class C family) [Maribacter sp.]|jgi:CubicO group peptidase (beta-lactamase class C family)
MRASILITLFALLALASCKNEKNSSPTAISDLESYTDSLFQSSLDSTFIAGGAILVHQKGKTLLKKAYGQASLELEVPMPENAIFEIGSVTKQFTAVAILKLVEDGKLALEDDFTQYLDYDTKGRKITIDQLLNHTSGIASYTEIEEFGSLVPQELPRDSLLRILETKDFLFEPGEALIYNNSAYFFLGLIIEKVTGKTYEKYLKEIIFEPLGMHNTQYCSNSKVFKNKAYGYDYTPAGLNQKEYLNHIWPYAAGSLCSTTEDLLIWMKAIHNGDFLTQQQYQELITPKTLNDSTPLRYAMGISHFNNYGNEEIGHGGGINGFLTQTVFFPQKDLYIISVTNTTGPHGGKFFVDNIMWQLLEKKDYESVVLDVDPKAVEGIYSGQTRGRTQSIEVKAITDAITVESNKDGNIDTLSTYVDNRTWMNGNTSIFINEGILELDHVGGHYILKKQ